MTITAGNELYWAADFHRGRESLVFDDVSYSYDEMDERSTRFAHMLLSLDCGKEDRVAVLLNNSVESLDSFFGCTKAGVAYVGLNALHTLAEQRDIIRDCDPLVVIAGLDFRPAIEVLAGEFPQIKFIAIGWQAPLVDSYEALMAAALSQRPNVVVPCDSIARIHYTSGTTGKPKGIVFRHSSTRERLLSFLATYEPELNTADTMLHVGPLTHAAGNYLVPCYLRGARNIVLTKFNVETLAAAIEKYRVTHLFLVPTMLTRFIDTVERGAYDLSSLKVINYGVASTPVDTQIRGIRSLGKIFRQHYGMSECPQPITVFPREAHDIDSREGVRRLASCGKLVFNVDLVLRNDDGVPVAVGEVGEISLKAEKQVAAEYWRRPDLMAAAIRDGWFYTGDLGRFDADGFLYIVGRNKDMIISGGFNIYSREVEDALHLHPGVLEAAVFGVDDHEWGETVVAAITLTEVGKASASDLIAFCKEHIASYKKPRVVYFLTELPRNNAGKIDKRTLKSRYLAAKDES